MEGALCCRRCHGARASHPHREVEGTILLHSRKDRRRKGGKQGVFRDQTPKTIPQAPGLRDGCRLEQTLRC
jgi:hypothetical protein